MIKQQFTRPLLAWYQHFGRQDLPWQHPRSPYYVWLSEIMLQQTQVKTVIPYFLNFIESYPDMKTLAQAPLDHILSLWAGLGYYSRARNLHRCAIAVMERHNGYFPADIEQLQQLPGIGPSTAAAIASLAFNQPTAILDGNVKRVLCRYFAIDQDPDKTAVKKELWRLAQTCMEQTQCADYTQAIMDLGATCCTRNKPSCQACPLQETCQAFALDCVDKLPIRTTKKARPNKTRHFYLLRDKHDRVLLQRNPDKGIWGGLWCLPNFADETESNGWLKKHFNRTTPSSGTWLAFKHTFTHFHLNLKVHQIAIEQAPPPSPTSQQWLTRAQIDKYGLPKPMVTILSKFWQGHLL